MTTMVSSGIFVTTFSHPAKNLFMIVGGYGSPPSARASSAIFSRISGSVTSEAVVAEPTPASALVDVPSAEAAVPSVAR